MYNFCIEKNSPVFSISRPNPTLYISSNLCFQTSLKLH